MQRPPDVTSARFQTLLESGQVSRVVIRDVDAPIALRPPAQPSTVSLRLPSSLATPGSVLIAEMDRQNVDYRFEAPNQWLSIALNFLPLLFLLGVPAFCLTIFLL